MAIRNKSISAFKWSAVDRLASQGIQFIISIILARLLLPEQFGLIAMLTIFFAVAQTFLDSGFGAALIQKKEPSQIDKCSIFYFNILVGFLSTLLIYMSAPIIADFYSQPILIPLTQFLSTNLLINSFSLVQFSLLSKELNFKAHAKISFLASTISGSIGVILAIKGYGVWALAIQQVLSSISRTILLWLVSDWRPTLTFSFQSLREMFGFGSKMLMAGLLDNVFKNIYLIVIGKLYPPALLGFYTRAQGLKDIVSLNLTQIITRVTFPLFSSIQDDNEKLKRGLKKAIILSSFIIFPAMVGMSAVAESLVHVLLTEQWLPSVFYLQLLCVVGMLLPLQALNLSIIKSKGRSDIFLWLEVVKKILIVVNISLTWRWGVEALIVGQVVLSFMSYFVNSFYAKKMIDYAATEQVKDIAPVIVLSISMGVIVFSLQGVFVNLSPWVLLFLQVLVGLIYYFGLAKLFKLAALDEMIGLIVQRIR